MIGKDEQLVIFTTGPFGAFVVFCWLKYYFRNGNVGLYHGQLKADERQALVDSFQNEELRFLVGSTLVLGVGLTLTRAFRCVLMDPEWLRTSEEQAIGRVFRVGMAQPSPVTYSYRILLQGFEPERVITTRQDARGRIQTDVYSKAHTIEDVDDVLEEDTARDDDGDDGDDGDESEEHEDYSIIV